jgi:hypothetical protein
MPIGLGTGRVNVRLSGYSKFSRQGYPFEDIWPFVGAIVEVICPL